MKALKKLTLCVAIFAVCAAAWQEVYKPSQPERYYPSNAKIRPAVTIWEEPERFGEIDPCPITEEEYQTIAELMVCEAEIVMSQGVKFGVSPEARVAAVAWVVLNRYDAGFEDSIIEVIKAPYQFAWHGGVEAPEWAVKLAKDVGDKWWKEKCGDPYAGRTIPADYYWFWGDGWENYFRNDYTGSARWDWSLPDPYKEGV